MTDRHSYLFNLNQQMLVTCVHITTPMTTTHMVHSASAAAASPFKSLKLGEAGLGAALTAAPPPCRCWPHPAGGPPQQQQTTAPQSAASPAPLPAGLTVPAHTAAAGGTWRDNSSSSSIMGVSHHYHTVLPSTVSGSSSPILCCTCARSWWLD